MSLLLGVLCGEILFSVIFTLAHKLCQNRNTSIVLTARGENGASVQERGALRKRLDWSLEECSSGSIVPINVDHDQDSGNEESRRFVLRFTPSRSGAHRMHLRVDGKDIRGSPFALMIQAPPTKLQTPVVTPSKSNSHE